MVRQWEVGDFTLNDLGRSTSGVLTFVLCSDLGAYSAPARGRPGVWSLQIRLRAWQKSVFILPAQFEVGVFGVSVRSFQGVV